MPAKIKMLIIGAALPAYTNAFRENGFDITYCKTHRVCSNWNIPIRIKRRLGLDISDYMKKDAEKLGQKIIKLNEELCPNVVVDVNGFYLNKETIAQLKNSALVIAQMSDRINFFPEFYKIDKFNYYDIVYTYSDEDATQLRNNGVCCIYLSSKGDVYHYKPLYLERDIDISFVGNMYPVKDYGERYDILKKLTKDFPTLCFVIGGKCAPLRRPQLFFEWLLCKRYRESFLNRNISLSECNEIYNRSKICLNIERSNTGNAWSGRLANILLTESFVIAQGGSKAIEDTFNGGVVQFSDYNSLKKLIEFYLDHKEERDKIARQGNEILQSLIAKDGTLGEAMSKDIKKRLGRE